MLLWYHFMFDILKEEYNDKNKWEIWFQKSLLEKQSFLDQLFFEYIPSLSLERFSLWCASNDTGQG